MSNQPSLRPFAERLKLLGTETAYAVSDEAKKLSSTGLKIYPYHIGDLNFATPEVFVSGTRDEPLLLNLSFSHQLFLFSRPRYRTPEEHQSDSL